MQHHAVYYEWAILYLRRKFEVFRFREVNNSAGRLVSNG
jgi:hypothetical protein